MDHGSAGRDGFDPERDLEVRRVIAAPVQRVWEAWADPRQFEQWWVPAPARCRVEARELRPGGAFRTAISEEGGAFGPHIDGCVLDVVEASGSCSPPLWSRDGGRPSSRS